ncbi:MAG: glycosyltransferase family 2 protein [Holophagaceae bacterium]|nr:glycosyltransferase family 2 protein [Holophagaceae bacterium]
MYRHAKQFEAFSAYLPKDIPVIIIDDGNTDEDARILGNIGFPIIRLDVNQGKATALLAGMNKAMDEGYTHVLQIDADGQHNPDDIPRFLSTSQDNPGAFINSCPIYDKSAPKSRVYGRKITNFWVWVETGNDKIQDAMCGFRVYPLVAMSPILKKGLVFKRMGVDIELLVRACWANIKIITLDTKVSYPKDGITNFSLLKDNMNIFALHTLLVCTRLRRLIFG